MSSTTYVSLPETFDTGKASEWFQRYEICCRVNGWDADKMALKLPTLLEGEALTIWLELTEDEQKNYETTKNKIINAIMPMSFISLDTFHKRTLRPGESLSLYVHELKQSLTQAMPDIASAAKEQSVLDRPPHEISKQLRANGVTTVLQAVESSQNHSTAAASIGPVNPSCCSYYTVDS